MFADIMQIWILKVFFLNFQLHVTLRFLHVLATFFLSSFKINWYVGNGNFLFSHMGFQQNQQDSFSQQHKKWVIVS